MQFPGATYHSSVTPRAIPPRLAIVVPCFNEEESLRHSCSVLIGYLDYLQEKGLVAPDSFILFCDDGSHDSTWQIIKDLHCEDTRIKGISLSGNRGQQNALMASLMAVRGECDAAISIDADLQDPPDVMEPMLAKYMDGNEIVYGVRKDRRCDSFFKRTSARGFYRLQNALGMNTVADHADFRLMSRMALDYLSGYDESNLFLRGILPLMGLKSECVEYARSPRTSGKSKYPLRKMLGLGIDGITSFSARPMRIIFLTGLALLLCDVAVAIYVLVSYFVCDAISGWSSLMFSVWFLGSLILMALGIVGEYVGKIFMEVKHRPRFVERERIW